MSDGSRFFIIFKLLLEVVFCIRYATLVLFNVKETY